MRITSEDRKQFRTFYNIKNYIFFAIIGVILTAVGILICSSYKTYLKYPEVEATITDIYSVEDDSNTKVVYEVDGVEYDAWLGEYSSSNECGDTLKIRVNPDNPLDIQHVSFFMPALMIGLGGLSILYMVYRILHDRNQREYVKESRSYVKEYGNSEEFNKEFAISDAKDLNEYYFHFCGKANQSHILETPEREPMMEARLTKFSLLGNCDYDFINYQTGTTFPHKIGKTTIIDHDHAGEDAWFGFDNQNIWNYIHANGIKIDVEFGQSLFLNKYHVLYNDREIGIIKNAGTAILEGVKSNAFTENATTPGLYKIYTSKENIPVMFLIALALARSDNNIHE